MELQEQIALHEAAHAVVARDLGRWFENAVLEDDGGRISACPYDLLAPLTDTDRRLIAIEVQVQLAGPIADERTGRADLEASWRHHRAALIDWAMPLGMPSTELVHLWTTLRPETTQTVNQSWARIEKVAEALQVQRLLSNAQVRDLIDEG